MRSDGARNREKVLRATSAILREVGPEVSLEAIATRAGVTRTTIYRNFEGRQDLFGSVLEREFAILWEESQSHGPLPLRNLIERLIDLVDLREWIGKLLTDPREGRVSNYGREKLHALVNASIEVAKAKGEAREDLTSREVLLACRMMASGWRIDGEPSREVALAKRLALIMPGLQPAKSYC